MSVQDMAPEDFLRLYESEAVHREGLVIDVREQAEWDYYHLDKSHLMPMNTIPERLEELPADKDLYIICAHGVRSSMVCQFLKAKGFGRVINVEGGMAAVAELKGFRYD